MTVESLLAELEPIEDAQVAPGVGTYRYCHIMMKCI